MREPQQTPDWGLMIAQLRHEGVQTREIGEAMGCQLTDRMVSHYANGTQPTHWRGEGLILLWCRKMQQERADIPQAALVRGHRARTRPEDDTPKIKVSALAGLAAWVKPVQKVVKTRRKKAGVPA